ncbi:hypothetical protein C5E05_00940 [Pseudoclavibacter sp. AY1H1]|nr:hypothetical protein C5E05_00940 [Pseudoclavibacter sp. AY1H1]
MYQTVGMDNGAFWLPALLGAGGVVVAALIPIVIGLLAQPIALRRIELLNKSVEGAGSGAAKSDLASVRDQSVIEYKRRFEGAGAKSWLSYGLSYGGVNIVVFLVTLGRNDWNLERLQSSNWDALLLVFHFFFIIGSAWAVLYSRDRATLRDERQAS